MKYKRMLALIVSALLVICMLPVTALAANYVDGFGNIYDESEYEQLKTFLNLDSASEFGYSNGGSMSYMYSDTEPYGWHNVTWSPYTEGSDTVYHVTEIDWSTGGSYYSLNGDLDLSNFTHLQSLKIDYAQIDSLDVTNDTELTMLQCTRTKMYNTVIHTGITALDLSTNTALETVSCGRNSITSLNTSAAGTNLISLYCGSNEITSLNISGNTSLEGLDCFENHISGTLDLTGFSSLYSLICYDNNLTGLLLDGCTGLSNISCLENSLTTLDVTDCTNLIILACRDNQLTSLNTGSLTGLATLNCEDNQLTALDVTTNTGLGSLTCSDNQLTALDVSHNTLLYNLECSGNRLTSLDVNSLTSLETLYCGSNQIETLSLEDAAALTTLDCPANELNALDLSHNPALQILRCGDNDLDALDLSVNTALTDLDCTGCGLTALDLSENTDLSTLYCGGNDFASSGLDLSQNTVLGMLDCSGDGLVSLDLSSNTGLMMLLCSDNQLTALDLSALPALVYTLDCSGNQLTNFDNGGRVFLLLDCTDNLLTHFKAGVAYNFSEDSSIVELAADGSGYVGLYSNLIMADIEIGTTVFPLACYAEATPRTNAALINWTDASDTAVSTAAKFDFEPETACDFTAHFLSLTSSDADGKIYTGGRVTLTPSIAGGTWSFDSAFFTREGGTFTALKAGTSTITYTAGGVSTTYEITIEASGLPSTGQDMMGVWALIGAAAVVLVAGVLLRRRLAMQK